MNTENRYTWLKAWITTPLGATAAVITLLAGFLLAIHAGRTFGNPTPPSYYADFTGAQWIHAPGGVDTGYFRKRVYIASGLIRNAWLQVTGPDYYEIYVNGTNLLLPATSQNIYPNMTASYISAEPQVQFDLTPYLKQGQNAICIYVRRRMGNRETGLLAKGFIQEETTSQWIYSDTSWKAKPIPNEMVGQFAWTGPSMDDDMWPNAEPLSLDKVQTYYQPLSIPSSIFTAEIGGSWIGPADPFEKHSYYQKDFTVPPGTVDSWLEIGSSAMFEVYLNNHLITNSNLVSVTQNPTSIIPLLPALTPTPTPAPQANDTSLTPSLTNTSTAATATHGADSIDFLPTPPLATFVNLKPWLNSGNNRLEIRVENSLTENVIQSEILFRHSDDSVIALSSDQSWSGHGSESKPTWQPALSMSPYGYPPFGSVTKLCIPSLLPSDEIARENSRGFKVGLFIMFCWLLGWITFSRMLAERRGTSLEEAHIVDALAQVPLILVLLYLWISQLDVRISPEAPYQPYVFYLLLIYSLFTRLALYLPTKAKSPQETEPNDFLPQPTIAQQPQSQHTAGVAQPPFPIFEPLGFQEPGESTEPPAFKTHDEPQPLPARSSSAAVAATPRAGVLPEPGLSPGLSWLMKYGYAIALCSIVTFSFGLRASGLMQFPLDYDECFMRNCVHGIVERGFPSTAHGDLFYRLSTYELIPWPEAFFGILSGWQDWSLRTPGLIYGTLTTLFLGVFGARIFDRRTGILAALCYACTSFDVYWTRDCFHMPQCQFSSLLCFYFFYQAIKNGNGVDYRYYRWACLTLCTTYLSWEGAGFLLPAFTMVLLTMHPLDWRWAKQFYFWAGLVFVSSVVLCQLCSHSMTQPAYLGLGIGLSDLTAPSLAFLDPNIEVSYYYYHFLLTPSHFLFGLLSLVGLFLFWNDKRFRFVLVLYFTLFLAFSLLLTVQDTRYAYFYQTMLILGGSAVAIRLFDKISVLARAVEFSWPKWPATMARYGLASLILLLFMTASEFGVKLYRITIFNINPDSFFRYNELYIDAESASLYVKNHFKPGDGIICVSPHCFQHFTGMNAFGDNPLLLKRMYYMHYPQNPGGLPSTFIDRYAGTTDIRDNQELQNFYQTHKRVWFVAAPYLIFVQCSDPFTSNYVTSQSELQFENSACRIYLEDGYGATSGMDAISQTSLPPVPPMPREAPLPTPFSPPTILPSYTGISALLKPETQNPLAIINQTEQDGPSDVMHLGPYYNPVLGSTSDTPYTATTSSLTIKPANSSIQGTVDLPVNSTTSSNPSAPLKISAP